MPTTENVHENPRPPRPLPIAHRPRPRPSTTRSVFEIVLAAWLSVVLLAPVGDAVYMEAGHPPALDTPVVTVLWLVARALLGAAVWQAYRGRPERV